MVSAAGSGELLFTPRVGAIYGYTLLWALLGAVTLKWFVNREIGRYAVCTGENILAGFRRLPGPANWAVWLIVIPQIGVAVASIAGLAGSAGTALILLVPGNLTMWMIVSVVSAAALVVWGRYIGVERVATMIGITLAVASTAAAISVGPDAGALGAGLAPVVPANVDYAEILPWLGFMLSGAAGMIWYSYWVVEKGYGAAHSDGTHPPVGEDDQRRLRGWLGQMTFDTTVAVVGTVIVALAFLVLGTELLRPEGLVPDEDQIAEVLGELLGGVWGRAGFWFMVLAVFVGFWDTVLSDQDGFGRMFTTGARAVPERINPVARIGDDERVRRLIVVVVLAVAPIILYLVVGNPVGLLKVAGAIEAAQIPVIAGLTLYLNRRRLPKSLQPSVPAMIGVGVAATFFATFTIFYLLQVI